MLSELLLELERYSMFETNRELALSMIKRLAQAVATMQWFQLVIRHYSVASGQPRQGRGQATETVSGYDLLHELTVSVAGMST
jgi:hypothetical protein